MGSPYQSNCMRRAGDMSEGICNRKILNFSYYCEYGVLVFGDDGAGPADETKRTKRVQRWPRQSVGGGFYCLQYYYSVKYHVIRVNMPIKRVDFLYNSTNQCMIRLW